jgi:sugar lactone lactonase YvrE
MAYDNLNAFLYVNYYNGNDDQQIITCANVPIQFTGNTTIGSTAVSVSSLSGLIAGQHVFASSIPAGDTIATVGPGNTITLTTAATGSATSTPMGANGPSNPGCLSISPPVYGNGLAVDGAGNVYTAFGSGSSSGYIAQFPPGFSGPNGNGRAYSPTSTGFTGGAATPGMVGLIGLAADNAGQVFVDSGAEIFLYSPSFSGSTPNGNFVAVAGTGVNGYNGDNGTATLLQLDDSEGVALDENGALWIADTVNNRIREITPAGFGQGEGTGSVTGGSPAFGCLQCGPQSLGNGTGGVAGYGNQPAPTDTIQTDRISNVTLLNPANHKLYIAYPNALAIFNTSNDAVESTAGSVDVVLQTVTQMVLDAATNDIWAITSAGQVLEINSATDQVINGPFAVATSAQAQAIAVDSKLNQVYVAYGVTSGITVSYHLAVVNGASGTTTTTLSLNGPAQAMVADSARGVAYLIAQDPYSACPSCPQYDYDIVVINGTTANEGLPIEITSTTTLIEGSEYSSGVTHSSLAIDPHTGKVVFADAVDAYFSLYNPAVPSYEATDHVSLGWIPNAVTIDTANSIAYITDSQYNNVQAVGLATVLNNTAYGWSYNLFSGTQGGNSCGFMANAVVPDASVGEVYITTCTVSGNAATPVLNQLQYTGVTANGSVLTPTFTCGYGPTCSPLDTYNLPLTSTGGLSSYTYVLNIDSSDHALFVQNGAGVPTGAGQPNTLPDILVFNGPYPPAARPQIQFAPGTTISFGNAPLGSTSSTTLTVNNIGAGSMLTPFFFDTGANAADFSAGALEPCGGNSLAPNGTCDVQLSFTPSRLAAESATFTVLDDSPDEPQTISVSGTGVLPVGSGTTPSSTLLQVSALQVMPGNQLKLYATVSPAIGSSGEQVIFLDNNTSPATVLGSGTSAGGSVWTLSTSTLAPGTHALTAYYAGDSTYAPSTSATVNVVISSSTGTGPSQPLLSFTPGSFYEAFNNTSGTTSNSDIGIDAAGDDFVLDSGVGSVAEYTVGGTTVSYVPAGSFVDPGGYVMTHPSGVAVAPTGGDVYITDTPSNVMAETTTAGSSFISNPEIYGLGACNGGTPTNFVTLSSPTGISIGPASKTSSIPNSAGYDLYLADSGNKRVLEINPVGGNTSQCGFYPGGVVDAIVGGTGSSSGPATLTYPLSVAASGSNVYIADAPPAITNPSQGPGTIYKNGVAISNPDIVFPYSLAVDAAGDLYYSDESLSQVWRIDTVGNFLLVAGDGLNSAPGTPCTSAAPCQATQTSILTPYGLAISGNGSIFIGDAVATGQVGEVNVTTGILSFPNQSTSTTSNALTVTVTDTASMPVGASGAVIAGTDMGDFAIAVGGTCNTSMGFILNPGQSCTILVNFTPQATGTRLAQINLTTQSEIYGGTLQTIQLNGNGVAPGSISQTITFPAPLRPVVYGAAADTLSATATSGLSVQYSILSGPGVLSGNTVSFTGAGTVKIVASQPGGTNSNGTYSAASSVEQDITVMPATLTVSAQPATRCYEAANPAFTASFTGFIPPDTQSSVVTGSPAFTVATNGYPDSPVGTVITVSTGQGTLALISPNYVLSLATTTLTVSCKEAQFIEPGLNPSIAIPITVGVPFYLTASASSGLPVTYTVESGSGNVGPGIFGGTALTATGTGTITVQISQPGNNNFNAATPVNIMFTGH